MLGTAVLLTKTLSMILTLVAYFTLTEKKVPFYPNAFWLIIKHGFFTFGIITSVAVFWQKYMGTIEVPLITAPIVIGPYSGDCFRYY